MEKLRLIPRFITEIAVTIVLYAALWALWNFVVKESVTLSDQGLSTIGLAVGTSLGVLTAIVVSFVLVTWQSSRQERSTSFWRWIDSLHKLSDWIETNLEILPEIVAEIVKLIREALSASLVAPMPRNTLKEQTDNVWNKIVLLDEALTRIKELSKEQGAKARANYDISNLLVLLTHSNFEHNVAHHLYRRVLSLRGLLYRLLLVLLMSTLVVAMGVMSSAMQVSDLYNPPLAVILLLWVIYVLIGLGSEIRKVTLFEDDLRRQETETTNPQGARRSPVQ